MSYNEIIFAPKRLSTVAGVDDLILNMVAGPNSADLKWSGTNLQPYVEFNNLTKAPVFTGSYWVLKNEEFGNEQQHPAFFFSCDGTSGTAAEYYLTRTGVPEEFAILENYNQSFTCSDFTFNMWDGSEDVSWRCNFNIKRLMDTDKNEYIEIFLAGKTGTSL